jgi:hypothetical protein
MKNTKPKITFAPGCFDHFEGTQDELNELITEITKQLESGEIESTPIDFDELMEEDPVFAEKLLHSLREDTTATRVLQ